MAVEEAPHRTFHPHWPDRTAVDPDRVTFSYWQAIDTLMVDFTGENPPAVSVPLDLGGDRDYVYLRLHPTTEEVLGLQIEDFLGYGVHRHPSLLDTLDLATLLGISRPEIDRVRREIVVNTRRHATIATLFNDFALESA